MRTLSLQPVDNVQDSLGLSIGHERRANDSRSAVYLKCLQGAIEILIGLLNNACIVRAASQPLEPGLLLSIFGSLRQ